MNRSKLRKIILEEYEKLLMEKWKPGVKIKSTGEHAGKSISQIKKEMEILKGKKPFDREKYSELLFALRAKENWPKHVK